MFYLLLNLSKTLILRPLKMSLKLLFKLPLKPKSNLPKIDLLIIQVSFLGLAVLYQSTKCPKSHVVLIFLLT